MKCIVLDLDETLVHTFDGEKIERLGIFRDPQLMDLRSRVSRISMNDVVGKKGAGKVDHMWVALRPGAREFLSYCFQHYTVVVWSAGKKRYVQAVVKYLFRGFKIQHVLSYDDCEFTDSKDLHKPLSKIITLLGNGYTLDNILLVDDRVSNFLDNPDNGLLVPPYKPRETVESLRREDSTLQRVQEFLESARGATNIRQVDKNIF